MVILTRKQFNSDLQASNDNAAAVNYCNAMNDIQTIVETVQVDRRPDHSQTTSDNAQQTTKQQH